MTARDVTSQTQAPTAVFALKDLCYSIDSKEIIQNITLNADERRIGIVGRNGSGKTTLARLLSGLVAPTRGGVHICGVDVARDRKAAIGTVGILFQNPDHQIIFPTVHEELSFGLQQSSLSKADIAARVAQTLGEFDKGHWADAATHQLSQGQKQLLCLMSIIAMRPKVVILDEPFAGLDLPTRAQLARYLDRTEAALIHISHDPDNLAGYERVIWLDAGQVRQDGAAAETLAGFTKAMKDLGGRDDISDLAG